MVAVEHINTVIRVPFFYFTVDLKPEKFIENYIYFKRFDLIRPQKAELRLRK